MKGKQIILLIVLTLASMSIKSQTKRTAKETKGLAIGTIAPMFKAIDANHNQFSLKKALESGPVVIIFYRGFWCPYCNKHLKTLQDSLQQIEANGKVKVIAISPEKPEYLDKMAHKTGAEFTLLYDEGYHIATAYDVIFSPSKMQLFTYNTFVAAKLKQTHSDNSQQLPIPATYIIGQDGKIKWRQFDPNYKNRSTAKEIIEVLKSL